MAEHKKSFILYADLVHTVRKLTAVQAGILFKTILEYVNDTDPEIADEIIELVFEPIKHQLKRDLKSWEETRKERVISGHLGGVASGISRKANKLEANEANASKSKQTKQTQANEAVNVNVTVNDTVNVNGNEERNTVFFSAEKEKFLQDGKWIYKFCEEKSIALAEFDAKAKQFLTDLELKEDYKPIKEIRSHFTNWFNLQKKQNGKIIKGNHGKPTPTNDTSGGFGKL
jgi:hypothetical protein